MRTVPPAVSPQPTPTRPGWGCGDPNHEHTGPPGNPDAESPCATREEPTDSGEERGEE